MTNDFPPRRGGVESFVRTLADGLAGPEGDGVVVYTASMAGHDEVDEGLPYPVLRDRAGLLLPTPRVRRAVVQALKKHECDRVLFGASVPLGLLAPALRQAGARRIVALTHGAEVMWSRIPGARQVLRHVGNSVDMLTDIADYTRVRIARALSSSGQSKQVRLAPGVDTSRFHPRCGGDEVRRQLGFGAETPVVVCPARLVRIKGHKRLINAWPLVLRTIPDAQLVLVGDGPRRTALERLARRRRVAESVSFTGSVPWEEMPGYMDAADVVTVLCHPPTPLHSREGLGIVFLEAAACGKPVLVGRSGGAPEATRDTVSGYVVRPQDAHAVSQRIVTLLTDRERARTMGARGRAWIVASWQWDQIQATCRELLELEHPSQSTSQHEEAGTRCTGN